MSRSVVVFFSLLATLLLVSQIQAQIMRDPTRPANKDVAVAENAEAEGLAVEGEGTDAENSQGNFPKVKLLAIVVTEDRKYAILNNEVVYEGQQWENILLSKVQPYSVTLTLNNQTKEITINNNDFITESDDQF